MTDPRQPTSTPAERPAARVRAIPPVVWIIIFLLIAWFAWAWAQRGPSTRTAQGEATPAAAPANGYMPATPPSGTAPGTPASNGATGQPASAPPAAPK